MTQSSPVPDKNWLEPGELYYARGEIMQDTELDRPIYQGDIFDNVPLLDLPKVPPMPPEAKIDISLQAVMVVPHPCQCYHGDKLRTFITVAPVQQVENYDNFTETKTGAKDKFALPSLRIRQGSTWGYLDHVANFSKLFSIPSRWLKIENRIACLSHEGLGLLAKRVLGFQLRDHSTTLANAMAFTQAEWSESFLMQAWVRRYGSLKGFTSWMRSPQIIEGLSNGSAVIPAEYRAGALDALMYAISGQPVTEPDD